MTTASLRMHINLSGIAGRIQRLLKQTTYLAAIGIRATEALSEKSPEMPELDFVFQYDHRCVLDDLHHCTASWRDP